MCVAPHIAPKMSTPGYCASPVASLNQSSWITTPDLADVAVLYSCDTAPGLMRPNVTIRGVVAYEPMMDGRTGVMAHAHICVWCIVHPVAVVGTSPFPQCCQLVHLPSPTARLWRWLMGSTATAAVMHSRACVVAVHGSR